MLVLNGEMVCNMILQSMMFNKILHIEVLILWYLMKTYCLICDNCNTSFKIFVTLSETFQ